jgi:tRNA pseudouridine38-40 synthase
VLKATLEYDGTRYRGWQAQMNARTVQGVFQGAVDQVLGEGVRVYGSGRTDAGVHALAQVASLHPRAGQLEAGPLPLERLRQGLNDHLPPDVHVLALENAPPDFHARHSALLRLYRYRVSRRRTAFAKPWVWWVRDPLDASRMNEAARLFLGRHDFSSFCENPDGHDSTLVEVSFSRVDVPEECPELILFRIGASHFLWKMVRRLVGALVEVGRGRLGPAELERMLRERSTAPAEWTAPPSGLFLEAVVYPGDPAPPEVPPATPGF